jgi:DHA3 family tetracycline resistance protein-like MFS transporter
VAWFGIISAAGMLSSATAAGVASRRVDTVRTARTVQTLAGVSAALLPGLLVFSLAASLPLAIAAYIVVHILRYMVDPLTTGWINHGLDPQVRATVLSMRSQIDALGQITGGPGIGWVARQNGYQAGLLVSTLLLSPVLWLFFYQFRKCKP